MSDNPHAPHPTDIDPGERPLAEHEPPTPLIDENSHTIRPRVVRTHLSLFVRDPEALAVWYQDVLGMEVTARGPQWVFLSFGKKHHDIALIRAEEGAAAGGVGLQHYGLEVAGDLDEWRRLYGMLLTKGVHVVKTTDHKVGFGLYFTDPDGNRFEFFHETVTDDEEGKRVLGLYGAPSEPLNVEPLYG
ncbi:VOC family protein [Streptomyces griseiscabiei]|uniref:VOC family protein n=2 Tax=Streptomyces griseiscabiei TaxID=2993540 RepID=A0ABU4L6G1_9ACTN|nr:VOC family protein [Streptomyces griseiscabiei]MBZ3906339.1 VOC family protein [Streptomyces griseiscabiei]MDX2911336.1 VOC family protein [Streptomyces griseiscabiei]